MPSSAVFTFRNQSNVPDTPIDKAVFDAALLGDNHSFGKLYDQYFDQIFRFLYYRTNHQQIAEDLTEEVFLKAFRSLSSLKGGQEKFRGWLFTIARHTVIDHYRKASETVGLEELEQLPSYEQSVVNRLELAGDAAQLLKALEQLKDEYQAVLKLRFFEDFEISEIAAMLGKSEGNIRIIQYRALGQLKKLLS